MSNGKRLAKKVDKLRDDIEKETKRGLAVGMGRLLGTMKHHLTRQRSVASGTLLENLEVNPSNLDHPQAYVTYDIVGPYYWRYLEFGTGRGSRYKAPDPQAPHAPIYEWIVEKGILPDPTGPYDTQEELAEAIAADTSTGTKAHKFARPAWRGPNGRDGIVREVADGIERAEAKF